MEKLEVFIVVHDQNIILDYEQNGKFKNLKLYRYVFVGSDETDKIDSNDKVIIARTLPDNIEEKKYLVSFTAWYALAKNNLINTEFICLLEYDVDLSDFFWEETLRALDKNVIVGYVPFLLNHILFLDGTPYLSRSLINVYGIDPVNLVYTYIQTTNDNLWASTTNMAMSTENFRKFVEWFIPLIREFDDDPISAHVHERAVKIFCILFNLGVRYLPHVLKHWQKKSHKIEAKWI